MKNELIKNDDDINNIFDNVKGLVTVMLYSKKVLQKSTNEFSKGFSTQNHLGSRLTQKAVEG